MQALLESNSSLATERRDSERTLLDRMPR
jgi:hypothetical protein